MTKYFNSEIGRLRLVGFVEGLSYIILLGIAMPFKYLGDDPSWVKAMGPIHGILFVLFIFNIFVAGAKHEWSFGTKSKLLLASIVPFANFYVDAKILKPAQDADQ